MRISDWSADVCSSDLTLWLVALSPSGERYGGLPACWLAGVERGISPLQASLAPDGASFAILSPEGERAMAVPHPLPTLAAGAAPTLASPAPPLQRSEEHTSELQSLMRISYAVFCLNKNQSFTIDIHTSS